MIEVKCQYCGKEFKIWISSQKRGEGKYCSKECCRKARKKPLIEFICQYCGKKFNRKWKKGIKFCSWDCRNKARKKRFKIKCEVCGKIFEVLNCQKNKVKYCSQKCYFKARTKYPKTWKSCLNCKKKFFTNTHKFCSKKCEFEFRSKLYKNNMLPESMKKGLVTGWKRQKDWSDSRIEDSLRKAIQQPNLPLISFFPGYSRLPTRRIRRRFPELYKKYLILKKKYRKEYLGKHTWKRGIDSERKAKKELEQQNYLVMKSGHSLGIFDLVAVNENEVLLIQIKRSKENRGLSRYKKEMKKIKKFKAPQCCKKMIWIWRDKKGWEKIKL